MAKKDNYCIELFNPSNKKEAINIKLLFKNSSIEDFNNFIREKNIRTMTRETADSFFMKHLHPMSLYAKTLTVFLFEADKKLKDNWKITDSNVIGYIDYVWFNTALIRKDAIPPIDLFDDEDERGLMLASVLTDPDSITDEDDCGSIIFKDNDNPLYVENIWINKPHRRKGFATYIMNNIVDFTERLFGYSCNEIFTIPAFVMTESEKEEMHISSEQEFTQFATGKMDITIKMLKSFGFEPIMENLPEIENIYKLKKQ